MRRIIAVLMLAMLGTFAVAQVGGNDWLPIDGQSWTTVEPDGVTRTRTLNYSPSTVTHTGDIASATIDAVMSDGSPIRFFEIQLNCRTRQYTFAPFDTSVTPAKLGKRSAWTDIQANSPGPAMAALVCKPSVTQ